MPDTNIILTAVLAFLAITVSLVQFFSQRRYNRNDLEIKRIETLEAELSNVKLRLKDMEASLRQADLKILESERFKLLAFNELNISKLEVERLLNENIRLRKMVSDSKT